VTKPATAGDMYREATLATEAECPEVWLARRLAAGKPAESWGPVPGWYYRELGIPVPAVPHQWSDQGRFRNAKGELLAQRPNGRPKELPPEEQYLRANICAGGKKVPVLSSLAVLAVFHPEARNGRQTRHLGKGPANRQWNWYPEGIDYCDERTNAFDKPEEVRHAAAVTARAAQAAAGMVSPRPTFPCRNQPRCGGMVANEGSRCGACVAQLGRDAAALLGLGMPSQLAGEFFGCTGPGWVYDQAVKHGGCTLTAAQARTQRPALWQRVRLMQVKRQIKRRMR
jgi:hypothetical protein